MEKIVPPVQSLKVSLTSHNAAQAWEVLIGIRTAIVPLDVKASSDLRYVIGGYVLT
jgi:hypothetical protein